MTGLYIYGIMRETDLGKLKPEILSPGQPFLVVLKDTLGAVAIPTDQEKFEATPEGLIGHFEVLSKLMKKGTVLPIRFGTVAKTEQELKRLLASLAGVADPIFERLAGKVEMDLEARWNPQVAYSRIAEADLQIKAFKERVASQAGAASLEDRLAVGKLMAEAVTKHADACRQQIREALSEIALESVPLPMKRDQELFMNIAFFVEEEKVEAFEKKIYALAESFQDAVHFKYAGPLPPYSFTGCEIMAATPAMLDEARQILELPETFTKDDFFAQYRRLSLLWHPDRQPDLLPAAPAATSPSAAQPGLPAALQDAAQPGDPKALDRFKKISASAELLTRFFDQYGQEFVLDRLTGTIFLVAKAVGYKEHLEWV